MKFYHRTSSENWTKIQQEGVLWGGDTWHRTNGSQGYRYTYLSPTDVGTSYGDVLLEVDYEPMGISSGADNYGFNPPEGEECWQFSVFIPITIDKIKNITLFEYIKKLDLKVSYSIHENLYNIGQNIYIMIESNFHVFIVDYNQKLYSDRYKIVKNINELKQLYFEKTSKNIELLLRKENLKNLDNYV